MAQRSNQHVVVVDGSNLATEGRTLPSLRQLDEAVRAYAEEDPDAEIVVVVDATFEHRVDASERAQLVEAELHGEVVSPPAGAIGRGDAFVLRIAERTGARVLSNDSFQEFHAEHPWLFDEGRLVGGKPVPGIGWIFTPRLPVRGPKSRQVTGKARRTGQQLSAPVKAAELAKAAKKASAARQAPPLPPGVTPRVGDVWTALAVSNGHEPTGEAADVSDGGAGPEGTPEMTGRATRGQKKAAKAAKKPAEGAVESGDAAGEAEGDTLAAAVPAKKPAAKKAATKKASTTRAGTTEAPATKKAAPANDAPPKASTKKAAATKAAAKKTGAATKAAAKAVVVAEAAPETKKAVGEEAPAKKAAAKKSPAKKPAAKKAATKKAATKKAAIETVTAEPAAKRSSTTTSAAKKAAATAKSTAKKSVAKKAAAGRAGAGAPPAAEPGSSGRASAREDPAVQVAIHEAVAEALSPRTEPEPASAARPSRSTRRTEDAERGKRRRRRSSASGPPPAVNEPLAFITFVATFPLRSELEGEVVSFTSHGAMVDVELPTGGSLHCYIPLTSMGSPPPSKAREVLARGERRSFVLVGLDPPRRVAELALPGVPVVDEVSGSEVGAG